MGYTSVVLGYSGVTLLREREDVSPVSIYQLCSGYIWHYRIGAVCRRIPLSSILLGVFHRALLLSYFLICLCTESSCPGVNSPILMSSWLLIMLGSISSVTFGGFLSKFSKCCFHKCIQSSWLAAFSLTHAVHFLLLTSFTVCHVQDPECSPTQNWENT